MICYRILALLLLSQHGSCFKVFVYSPRFAVSHVKFMGRIADILVEEGHDVTVLQPITNLETGDVTGVSKAKLITVQQSPEIKDTWPQVWGEFRNPWIHEPHFPTLTQSALHFAQQCNYTILQRDIIERLKDQEFDIGIAEGYDHCGPALLKIIGCKSRILTSSTVSMESINGRIGVPNIYSYVPISVAKASDKMDFKNRLHSLITALGLKYYYYRYRSEMDIVLQHHFGADFPDMEEIFGTTDLVFTNSHPYLDFPHPTLEKIVDVGGIGVDTPKPLGKEWTDLLALRPHSVFISFGSVAYSSIMPTEWRDALLAAMKSMSNVTFIWKYEDPEDNFASSATNVVLTKWAPQVDLLFSGRLSLFVTHGGLGSVFETASSGTAALFVPLFADQFRNALMCERKGFSETIDKHKLADVEFLKETLTRMLSDKRYGEAARQTARRLSLRPATARELLVRHVDLAGHLGALHFLDPAGRTLGYVEYFCLDILMLVLTVFVLIALIVLYVVKRIYMFTIKQLFGEKRKRE